MVGRAKAKPSTRAKWRSSECTDWCASKVLDTADIVREEMLHQLTKLRSVRRSAGGPSSDIPTFQAQCGVKPAGSCGEYLSDRRSEHTHREPSTLQFQESVQGGRTMSLQHADTSVAGIPGIQSCHAQIPDALCSEGNGSFEGAFPAGVKARVGAISLRIVIAWQSAWSERIKSA